MSQKIYSKWLFKIILGIIASISLNCSFFNQVSTNLSSKQIFVQNSVNVSIPVLVNGMMPFSEKSPIWLASAIFPSTDSFPQYGRALAINVYQLLVDNFLKPFASNNKFIIDHNNIIRPYYVYGNNIVNLNAFINKTKIGDDWSKHNFVQQDIPSADGNNAYLRATTKFIKQLLEYYLLPFDQLPCFEVFASPISNSSQTTISPMRAFIQAIFSNLEGDKTENIFDKKYNAGMFDFDATENASPNYRYLPANLIFMLQLYYNFLAHIEFKYYTTEGASSYQINFYALQLLSYRSYIQLYELRDATFPIQDASGLLSDGNNYNLFTAFPWFFINAGYAINPWGHGNIPGDSSNWKPGSAEFHSTGVWQIGNQANSFILNHTNDVIWKDLGNKSPEHDKLFRFWIFAWQSAIFFFQSSFKKTGINYFKNLLTPVKANQLMPDARKLSIFSNAPPELQDDFSKGFSNLLTGSGFTRDFVQKEWIAINAVRNEFLITYQHGYAGSYYFIRHRNLMPLNFPLPKFETLWNISDFNKYGESSKYYQNFVSEQHAIAVEYNDLPNETTNHSLSTATWVGIILGCTIGTILLTIIWIRVVFFLRTSKNHQNKF